MLWKNMTSIILWSKKAACKRRELTCASGWPNMHMASGITHLALNAIAGCYSDYAHEWEKSKLSYFTSLLLFPSAPGAPPWVFLTHPSAALTNNPAGSSSSAGPYGCCWGLLLLPATAPSCPSPPPLGCPAARPFISGAARLFVHQCWRQLVLTCSFNYGLSWTALRVKENPVFKLDFLIGTK